jgi:hypothetical protein
LISCARASWGRSVLRPYKVKGTGLKTRRYDGHSNIADPGNGKRQKQSGVEPPHSKLNAHYFAFFLGAGVFDFFGFGVGQLF